VVALRYAHVLALAAWLGGMLVLGAVVAPATFGVLESSDAANGRALAGRVFGTIVARFHYVQYASAAVLVVTLTAMRLIGPKPRGFAARLLIVLAMFGVALYSGVVVLGAIDAIQREIGGLASRLPAGDPLRVRFDELHLLSTRLMMANVALAMALLFFEARGRE
jgi:uncharacterized membrane protein